MEEPMWGGYLRKQKGARHRYRDANSHGTGEPLLRMAKTYFFIKLYDCCVIARCDFRFVYDRNEVVFKSKVVSIAERGALRGRAIASFIFGSHSAAQLLRGATGAY